MLNGVQLIVINSMAKIHIGIRGIIRVVIVVNPIPIPA